MLPVLLIFSVVLLVAFGVAVRTALSRQQVLNRLSGPDSEPLPQKDVNERGFLSRWLFLAGYSNRNALTVFLLVTLLLGMAGGFLIWLFYALNVVTTATGILRQVPGGVGDLFIPVVYLGTWMPLLLLTLLPTLQVRSARKKRVRQIEQDLPLTLDLLVTFTEAGASFDSALQTLVTTQPVERPLFQELQNFLRDVLAGRPRTHALRRLSQRLDVVWFSIFISAVIQAEQTGAGMAEVLRTQADDLRNRRRERALQQAMAIQIKLLFPLIACFLPGIFVATLGPMFYQIVQTLDTLIAPLRGG